MSKFSNLVLWLTVCVSLNGAVQAEQPLQMALWPPDMQLVGEDSSISGLRLNIYGRNYNTTGLDLGFVHESRGNFRGVALGLISMADENMHGLQWTWLYARGGGEVIGWQAGLLSRTDGLFKGIQTSGLNLGEADGSGLQLAFLYNYTAGHLDGLQLGLVNRATSLKGLQLGLVNLVEQMEGLQIGLWNEIDSKDTLTILPVVNWKF